MVTLTPPGVLRQTSRPASHSWLRALPATALVLDAAIIVGVGLVAIVGRRELDVFTASQDVEQSVSVAGPLIMASWLAASALWGAYRVDVFGVGTDEYRRVLNAGLVAAGLSGVGCYLAKFDLSRGFFVLAFLLGIPALLIGRLLLRRAIHQARRHGTLRQRVLISGSPAHVDEVAGVLAREAWLGYEIVGALLPSAYALVETTAGIPVLGSTDDAAVLARESGSDIILFADGGAGTGGDLRRTLWDLEREKVQVVIAPSLSDISSERVRARPVGGLPLLHVDPPTWSDASRWGKRTFDVIGASALLLFFTPVLLVVALCVRMHDGGPVLFRQTRVGRDGEGFFCFKFRTMSVDAEHRLAELQMADGHREGLFKMKCDPRITPPGTWLRRFSLDELPQLFNVLRGDMSLVGPRPPLPHEVATYDDDTHRRLRVRPGMTGLWQISGRSDLSWSDAVRLDLYYVDNWSMLQDVSILARTLGAVLSARGAY